MEYRIVRRHIGEEQYWHFGARERVKLFRTSTQELAYCAIGIKAGRLADLEIYTRGLINRLIDS